MINKSCMILNNSSLHALVAAIPNKLLICIGLIGFGEGKTGPQKYLFREKKGIMVIIHVPLIILLELHRRCGWIWAWGMHFWMQHE